MLFSVNFSWCNFG